MPHHRGRIARDDLHPHAGGDQPGHGGARRGLRRIEEDGAADEDEIGFVGRFQMGLAGGQGPAGDGQQAQALAALFLHETDEPGALRIVERRYRPVRGFHPGALGEHRLGRAFRDQLQPAGRSGVAFGQQPRRHEFSDPRPAADRFRPVRPLPG